MHTTMELTDGALALTYGGTAEGDSFARDFGQFFGGAYRASIEHPFLAALPFFGTYFTTLAGIEAARN